MNSEILYSSLYDPIVFFKFSYFIAVIIIIITVTSCMKRALKGSVISSVCIYIYKTFAKNVLVSLISMSLITKAVECQ